jgi:MFS-type transporter involved in bile tolerance (Atg22 family)
LGMVGISVPLNAWSQDLLPEGKRGQFNGIYNIINTVSQVFGSMSVGIATTFFGGVFTNELSWIFVIVPAFFVASIPCFMRVKETLIRPETATV